MRKFRANNSAYASLGTSGLSNLKGGIGNFSRFGDSHGYRHRTVAIAKTAEPNV